VAEILRAGEKIDILVGDQALSIWAIFYQGAFPTVLTANATRATSISLAAPTQRLSSRLH
jgi:hypothetical protein